MKVKDLIERLSQLDPEIPVILQEDPEGNGFRRADGAELAVYRQFDEESDLEIFDLSFDPDSEDMKESEWRKIKKNRCAVIWPS